MVVRIRLAIALISVSVIGLEITILRILALRFWTYFAAMAVSVGLLGIGFSGTVLSLGQIRPPPSRQWLSILGFSSGLATLFCSWMAQYIPLDINYLPWNLPSGILYILIIECLMVIPFLLFGAFLCLALMDSPERINGHYAANLAGSGAGAFLALGLMNYASTTGLLLFWAILCYSAGLCLLERRSRKSLLAGVIMIIGLPVVFFILPSEIRLSPYKKLAFEKSKPDIRIAHSEEGPQGRIDIVEGPSIHDTPPGMSLQNPWPIPRRSLIIVDGNQTYIVYGPHHSVRDEDRKAAWRFLDFTTGALPFALGKVSSVLTIGPDGGSPIALSMIHGSGKITALEPNRRIIGLLKSLYQGEGLDIYSLPQVEVIFEEPRSFINRTKKSYDLILFPLLDPGGSAGGGLSGVQENFLFTLECFRKCLGRLTASGMLCITVYSKIPPRDGIRIFNLALEALLRENLTPGDHLALIRNWETVTVLAKKSPLTGPDLQKIRSFSDERGFDIGYMPGQESPANRYHMLPEPYYFHAAKALLGPGRKSFMSKYLFSLDAPTDDRPYFNHFLRWGKLPELERQLKGTLPAFLEPDSLFMVITLFQVTIISLILFFLPLVRRMSGLRTIPHPLIVLLYFCLLGLGFMSLEMSFLQRMTLYLGHPIYSAAAVIASFLIFGGLGSLISGRWQSQSVSAACISAILVAVIAGIYLKWLDPWLGVAQNGNLYIRFGVIAAAISPLAVAMGHMFPIGLRHVGAAFPRFIPWCWAANGFAAVLATAATPVAAMSFGFSSIIIAAMGCYGFAAVTVWYLPRGNDAD